MSDYRGSGASGASVDEDLGEGLMMELKGSTNSVAEERASVSMGGAGRQWDTILRTPSREALHHPGADHESLDYDQIHSDLDRERGKEFAKRKFYGYSGASVGRWVLTAACGLLIGITAFSMSKAIEGITTWKMDQLTARIKVDGAQRTNDNDHIGLYDGSASSIEDVSDALSFGDTQECADILFRDDVLDPAGCTLGKPGCVLDPVGCTLGKPGCRFIIQGCGDLSAGADHCFWDNTEANEDGECKAGKVCCVQKAASPLIFFFFVNTSLALLACLPVVLFSKEAAGSGIPEVMGYLNGVHIRKLLKLRTLLAKIWGTVMIVSSGAAVGPEGPLVHSGAIIGSGLTRGHKTCGKKRFEHKLSLFTLFHNDTDRRDFISMGAAAGFAAAFGAPVGGVLFALEEASSFWNAKLMWRLLLCTSLACFTLSLCRNFDPSFDPKEAGGGSFKFEPGMLTLNTSYPLTLKHQWELLLCCVLGCLSGVLGALFNKLVAVSQPFRPKPGDATAARCGDGTRSMSDSCTEILKLLRQHCYRIAEVVFISLLTSCVTYGLPYLGAYFGFACRPESGASIAAVVDGVQYNTTYDYETYAFYCPTTADGVKQYNDMATIFLSSRENSILSLVEHPHAFSVYSLIAIAVSFFLLMIISFGAAYPAGIFMPTIVVGCTFGALYGRCAKYLSCMLDYEGELACMENNPFGASDLIPGGIRLDDPTFSKYLVNSVSHAGPYALLGAVGLLGGIQRSSVSLVVIIVEGTGKVDYLLPIIFTTVCAKWVGDHLNDGIYHTAMHVKGIPFLENEPTRGLRDKTAGDLMCKTATCVPAVARVSEIRDLLLNAGSRYNGFPVVKKVTVGQEELEVYQGVILLQNLGVLLRRKRWYAKGEDQTLERVTMTRTGSNMSGVKFGMGAEALDRARTGYGGGAAQLEGTASAPAGGGGGGLAEEDGSGAMAVRTKSFQMSDMAMDAGGADAGAGAGGGAGAIEMSPVPPSPATRGTISDMNHAKHRSNHDELINDALRELTSDDLDMYMNIAEVMNKAPYHVLEETPAFKVHRLFRTMGLRHLVVTSELNAVVGIITRADLIRHSHTSTDGHSVI